MEKRIKIKATEGGNKYFIIHEVRVEKLNGERYTYDRYFDEKRALEVVDFLMRNMQDEYRSAWIMKEFVWC